MSDSRRLAILIAVLSVTFLQFRMTADKTPASVKQLSDGQIVLENDWVRVRFNPDQGVWPGYEGGVQSWVFKPTGVDMVDFRPPGFSGHMNGHLLTIEGHPSSVFNVEKLGVDPKTGAAGCLLVKNSAGHRYWLRLTLRPGSAVLDAEFGHENISGDPKTSSLKLNSILSPGARDGNYQLGDVALYPTADGVVSIEQKPHAEKTMGLFEAPKKHRYPRKPWKRKAWLKEKIPELTGFWQAVTTPSTGDAFIFLNDPEETAQLLSWVGDDLMTMEQQTRSNLLPRGEIWRMNMALAGVSGVKTVAWANRFAVFETLPKVENGNIRCGLVGLVEGTIEARDSKGSVLAKAALTPKNPTDMQFAGNLENLAFVVKDESGTEIGRIAPDGEAEITFPSVTIPPLPHPTINGTVYLNPAAKGKIAKRLSDRSVIVVHGQNAPAGEEALARRIARTFNLPVASDLMLATVVSRRGRSILCVGTPEWNRGCDFLAGTAGLMPEDWPPKDKGVIRWTDNFVFTGAPAVLVSSRDEPGLKAAVNQFLNVFAAEKAKGDEQLTVWPGSPMRRIFKYDRGDPKKKLVIDSARNGFACAHFGISAPAGRSFSGVKVELTGRKGDWPPDKRFWKEMDPQIHLADYYVNGGNEDKALAVPDPLREITTFGRAKAFAIPAGETRAIWISFRPSRKMKPGDVPLQLRVIADGETISAPFTLRILDVQLPNCALEFQPFVQPWNVAHFAGRGRPFDDHYYFRMYKKLIENLVDHGTTNFMISEFYVKDVEKDKIELITRFVDRELDIIESEAKNFPWTITLRAKKLVTEAFRTYKKKFPKQFDYSQWHWKGTDSPIERLTVKALADYFKSRGILDRVYPKIADEPSDFARWLETTTVWREEGFKIHTHFNKFNDSYQKGAGNVDLWVPNYTIYSPEFYDKRMADGEKVWWYICWIPRTIVPCELEGVRGWLWLTAKYNLQGIGMWGVGCWGYHNDLYRQGNGVNSMIYPSHGSGMDIDDSIRWEQVRAAIEDHKYVAKLREAIAQAEKEGRKDAAAEGTKTLEKVFAKLVPTSDHYKVPEEEILWARGELAAAVVKLEKGKK